MTLDEAMRAVWEQALRDGRAEVQWDGRSYPVGRTRAQGLRTVAFRFGDEAIEAIEQNPETKSRWAAMAREGKRILQFRARGRYVANVCEGTLTRYPASTSLGLPP